MVSSCKRCGFPSGVKAACLALLGRDAEALDVVCHCRSLGIDAATPDGWEKACRRILAPEAFAMMAPALAIYRKVWDETAQAAS